jgi:tetratricopeptide (TPR) repeat protein
MPGISHPSRLFFRFSLTASLLGLGLALAAAGPAAAESTSLDCAFGSKASPFDVITACNSVIDNNDSSRPDRVAALLVRADARGKTEGGMTQALADVDRAIALDAKNATAFRLRGDLTRQAGGNLAKAEADLSTAITLDPHVAEAYEQRGIVYTNQHRLDRAIADYDQAIKMQPRANFLTNRADSYQFKGELGTALEGYDAALRMDPNFALAYNNRAVVFEKMGDRTRALADYEAALRIDPGFQSAADGRRSMRAEIAKFGGKALAPMSAPEQHPAFDCATTRLAVEKAICADPQLGVLDHQISDTYARLLSSSGNRSVEALRRSQRDFIAERNAGFGKPGYDLRLALQKRLDTLQAAVR